MEINIVLNEKHYVTTRKMQCTQDCVRNYETEDYHPTLAVAKECVKEYNDCFNLPSGRVRDRALDAVISKYNLKGSTYDCGKMLNDIYVMTIKRRHIELK